MTDEERAHEAQAAAEERWYSETFGVVPDDEVTEIAARVAERWREALNLLADECATCSQPMREPAALDGAYHCFDGPSPTCYEKAMAAKYEHDVVRLGGKSDEELRDLHREMADRAPRITLSEWRERRGKVCGNLTCKVVLLHHDCETCPACGGPTRTASA